MLQEVVAMFLDAYHTNIPYEYEDMHYFESVITVGVELSMLIGAILMAVVTAWGTFKIINGVFGRA